RLERNAVAGKWCGDELAAPAREHGDLRSRKPAHLSRPAARRDHHHRRLEVRLRRPHGEAPAWLRSDARYGMFRLDHRAQLAGASRDGRSGEIWIGEAVARRVCRGDEILCVEVWPAGADVVGLEHAGVHPQAPLELGALRVDRALRFRLLEDQIAVLPELRIDAELGLEVLVDDDALLGELDADPMGILVTDAAAGQRGGA